MADKNLPLKDATWKYAATIRAISYCKPLADIDQKNYLAFLVGGALSTSHQLNLIEVLFGKGAAQRREGFCWP